MSISYTPILVKLSDGIISSDVSDKVSSSIMEKAIQNAINNAIVIPLQEWALRTWGRFVGVSRVACLSVAITGALVYIVGIDNGKKIAIIAVVTYLGIQLLDWVIMGG